MKWLTSLSDSSPGDKWHTWSRENLQCTRARGHRHGGLSRKCHYILFWKSIGKLILQTNIVLHVVNFIWKCKMSLYNLKICACTQLCILAYFEVYCINPTVCLCPPQPGELEYLTIDLILDIFIIKDSFNIHWKSEGGIVENIESIVEEYKNTRQLLVSLNIYKSTMQLLIHRREIVLKRSHGCFTQIKHI